MALTYYIRSWDPRSTYPTNPQEGDICYTITLDQTWAPVGGVKKDNIVKEEIYQNGAWVEQGGGGGGGGLDFYIPKQTVTLTDSPEEVTGVDIPTTGANGAYYDVFIYIGGEMDMYFSLHDYYNGSAENFLFTQQANGLQFSIAYITQVEKWMFYCLDADSQILPGTYTIAVTQDPLGTYQ